MKKSLYLLEFGPSNEQILEQIAVQAQLEKIINNYAQSLNLEIDSCDILSDYIAITFYLNSLVDVDAVILALKKNSSDALVKKIPSLKQFVVNDSLWIAGYDIELL